MQADSFVIEKIKGTGRRIWDENRMSMIEQDSGIDWENVSRKLPNPGKRFFIKLAADVGREVNYMRDREGVLYSMKAIICCEMVQNLNGR